MHKIYTKSNRLMTANEFNLEEHNILCNDVNLPSELMNSYNPHNIRMWLIGHMHGSVCAVFASNEQDALDNACDANKMESFLVDTNGVDEQDLEHENYTYLGNAGEAHDLDDCWIAEVDFKAERDIKLIVKLARAYEGGHDTLDF